jgi:predicted phosphodiesterase
MLYLCVSDIHGRLDALAAILATAEKRNVHKLLVAGDIVFPGPQSLETWRRLQAAGAVMVAGLTDEALARIDPDDVTAKTPDEAARLDRMRAVQTELGDLVLQQLRTLPREVRIPLEDGGELLLVHASPASPFEALSHDLDDDEFNALLGDEGADLIVCGMSHVPFVKDFGDQKVINVGSVGDAPDARASSSEEPKVAHAVWIESTAAGTTIDPFWVPLRPR